MLRLDHAPSRPFPWAVEKQLERLVEVEASRCDAILVSDYGSGVVTDALARTLQRLAAEGMTVCADSRYGLQRLVGLTVCKPNEPELQALTGMPVTTDAELFKAGRAAQKALRCQALLVTRGKNGMALFSRRTVETLAVHGAREAVDVTGAGDTVIAALTLSLAAGASVLDAARLANVAAALVVQKQGTATVSRQELLGELEGRAA
ncbi:MAG TPA: PfkB family carbohydrate kinase, partial [Myxococcaceae bacterium]|nr:PfkB family carbohydrate kinase [Myxococcaceae bacterium]